MRVSFHTRKTLRALWLICILPQFIFSQEDTEKELERYKKVDIEKVHASGNKIAESPGDTVKELNEMLNEFYLSDVSNKKLRRDLDLQSDMPYDYPIPKSWNKNIQRLFIKDFLSENGRKELIKDAPNLFYAHYYLSEAYRRQENLFLSSYHAGMAFRYRTMKFSPEIFIDKDRIVLRKDKPNQTQNALNYIRAKEDYQKAVKEEYALKEKLIISEDKITREGKLSGPEIKNMIQKNKTDLETQSKKTKDFLAKYEEQKRIYTTFEKEYNIESAEKLVHAAGIVKSVEDFVKKKQRIVDQKTLYKTTYNAGFIRDFSPERNFIAYENLLETASRLYPENPQISFTLAEEYRTSEKTRKAIYAYEKALKAKPDKDGLKLDAGKIAYSYNILGALYFRENRYVDSAYYYEKALENADAEMAENLTFQTAILHTEKTGNFKRAEKLLQDYDLKYMQKKPDDVSLLSRYIKTKIKLLTSFAEVYAKTRRIKNMKSFLKEAVDVHEEIENMISAERNKEKELYEKTLELKKPLLDEEVEEDAMKAYYEAKEEYENQKILIREIEAVRNSLPLKKIYFTLAQTSEKLQNIKEAVEVYRKAELLGVFPDAARKNLDRIRKKYNLP